MKELHSLPLGPDFVRISPYRLVSRHKPNAASRSRWLEGALIEANGGYGCIHPWPELGDPPLEACLADLAGARRWPIVRRALRCAEFDRVARRFEHSLFEELEVPISHATMSVADPALLETAVERGFKTVKLKCGRSPSHEATFLNEQGKNHPELRWRLDFNEQLTPSEVDDFLESLSTGVRCAIDFLEDPCPYSESAWKKLHATHRIPLAVDREAAPHRTAAQVMVIKPNLDEPLLLAEAALSTQQSVVVTSAMDHPVGQTFAAWEAARLQLQFPGLVGVCGLQTHHGFEPNPFIQWLGDWTPDFHPPAGLGLGFDELFDELVWQDWPRRFGVEL